MSWIVPIFLIIFITVYVWSPILVCPSWLCSEFYPFKFKWEPTIHWALFFFPCMCLTYFSSFSHATFLWWKMCCSLSPEWDPSGHTQASFAFALDSYIDCVDNLRGLLYLIIPKHFPTAFIFKDCKYEFWWCDSWSVCWRMVHITYIDSIAD